MKKIGKANCIKSTKMFEDMFIQFGGIKSTNAFKETVWTIKTKFGDLVVHNGRTQPTSCIYTVYSRFSDDVDLKVVGKLSYAISARLNHYSGKFNYHETDMDVLRTSFLFDMFHLTGIKVNV